MPLSTASLADQDFSISNLIDWSIEHLCAISQKDKAITSGSVPRATSMIREAGRCRGITGVDGLEGNPIKLLSNIKGGQVRGACFLEVSIEVEGIWSESEEAILIKGRGAV